jgi:hypothetical protein
MMSILERYPVLARLPEDLRAGYAAKADAGLALTVDECVALGFAPCDSFVLMPACGPVADLKTVFAGDWTVLREIVRGVA